MRQDTIDHKITISVEAVSKAQEDPEAFRIIYEASYKTIFLFILHKVEDKELTADITSQTFLKAFVNIKKYHFKGLPFSAWLYRIAINECNYFLEKPKGIDWLYCVKLISMDL